MTDEVVKGSDKAMSANTPWLMWSQRIQAIAQTGLTYSQDVFDRDRYKQLQSIASEMISLQTPFDRQDVEHILSLESGYPTPKVDVRAVIFDDIGRLLMAREMSDGGWSMPGGWADIGDSVSEAAVRETYEETGYRVRPIKLLGLLDRNKHPHPPMFWHVYKAFVQCEIVGGRPQTSVETDSIEFFDRDSIPALSTARVTASQIQRMFEHYDHPGLPADLD